MTLEKIAGHISHLTSSKITGGELHFKIEGHPHLTFELSIDSFGFADQKETRAILTTEIQTTKESIARFVTLSNPFADPWYAKNNARLSMHEEFISVSFPPEAALAEAALVDQTIAMIVAIRASLA